MMPLLRFESFNGNSLVYNRENVLPTSSTHAVGDTWSDTDPEFTKKTASLVTVGVQSSLDRYISQTRSNVQDPEAALLTTMSKSLSRKIQDLMITGEPENVSTEFEGLDSLVRSETRMMAMDDGDVDGPGDAETELTLDRLDAMIDLVESGKPDALIMNKTMRRKLSSLARAAGSGIELTTPDQYGHQYGNYQGIPIVVNDFITDSEQYNDSSTWPSSTATTIFAVKFGKDKQGHAIIHNGPVMEPDVQRLGTKENKNADGFRIAVYMQTVVYSAKMIAALGGIDSSA